jgi:putative transposase
MPWSLRRFQQSGKTHFVTFSCAGRRPLLASATAKRIVEIALERVRCAFDLRVYGYVVMPEHVHLLLSEPKSDLSANSPLKPEDGLNGAPLLADALKSLKQGVARRLLAESNAHFWLRRYYDRNVRDHEEFVEKLRYIHRNPVKRGLCSSPDEWEWSSFRQWATGCAGRVDIECEWTANRRERAAGRLSPAVSLPHP